jgi:pyruvate/2-oxoglutarate dehydrogenase complex dihydrolipoamide dehydrogenase (E3) component
VRAGISDGLKRITIEQNNQTSELHAEQVLVATGRQPNIEALNLEAAGVKYDKQRNITDEYLRTSANHIYAAGDVTGHFPLRIWRLTRLRSLCVTHSFLASLQKTDFHVVPWTTFTDPEIAHVGLTETEAHAKFGEKEVCIYRTEFTENDRAQAEEETYGFVKIVCAGRKQKIVGASIVGAHAGELLAEVVLAMKQRLSVTALGSLIHAYPTLTQVNQQAGLDAILAKLSS